MNTVSASPWPWRGSIGVLLVALFWSLNWGLGGARTHWGFFPLWLGYCLVMDAWVFRRTGTSPWHRSRSGYVWMFVASAPVWWLFELFNLRLQNWEYLGRELFTEVEFFLLSTLSFSTVIPAVLTTAEWVASFFAEGALRGGPRLRIPRRGGWGMHSFGWALLASVLTFPAVMFPWIWAAVYFIVEPINVARGRTNLIEDVARGDYRRVFSLALGCLVCGFFWEMWNYYSYPKWIYHIPGVDFGRVFEMPVLGYLGYLGFGLEIHALFAGLTPSRRSNS